MHAALKLLFFPTLLAWAALAIAPAAARAGGMDSGGGDISSDETDSAWFLGGRPIRYCLSGDEAAFGVPHAQVSAVIKDVFAKWDAYVAYKGVENDPVGEPMIQLSFYLEAMDRCDGSEDLRFYLGDTDDQVEAAKAQFNHPVAFAHRSYYDTTVGWGKGFVWLGRPDSAAESIDWGKNPDALYGMLLHEIGHVLGNSHVQSTIMDEDIAEYLSMMAPWPYADPHHIDWGAELAEDRYGYPTRGTLSADRANPEDAANFKRVTGREPTGAVTVSARLGPGGWMAPFDLVFEDAQTFTAHLVFGDGDANNYSFIRFPNPIFKRACPTSSHCGGAVYQRLHAGYLVGTLTTADGSQLPAFVEFNLGKWSNHVDAPVQVKFWENGRKHDIFAQTELR